MSKRQINAKRKRQAIVDSARHVFLTEGYVDANMDRIADDANVTKQTVYRYFPSKRSLFTATLHQLSLEPSTAITAHLDNPDTDHLVHAFTGMLLTLRNDVLVGLPQPTDQQIREHATRTADFFIAAIATLTTEPGDD